MERKKVVFKTFNEQLLCWLCLGRGYFKPISLINGGSCHLPRDLCLRCWKN